MVQKTEQMKMRQAQYKEFEQMKQKVCSHI